MGAGRDEVRERDPEAIMHQHLEVRWQEHARDQVAQLPQLLRRLQRHALVSSTRKCYLNQGSRDRSPMRNCPARCYPVCASRRGEMAGRRRVRGPKDSDAVNRDPTSATHGLVRSGRAQPTLPLGRVGNERGQV